MNAEVKNLVEEINQIRAQFEAEVGSQKRRAWPKAIVERVLRLCELTRTFKEAGELVGISPDSIYIWRAKAREGNFKQLAVVNRKPKNLLLDTTNLNPKSSKSVTVTVTTPNGFLIEGLSSDLAIDFLLKLGDDL